ncbi:MAG: T9SS type A sorting domain-containing protein [Bacteroidetes bacterium]|nr:T9SS type A sorting domain-containing protein [Bacteroidota bacterium]
MIKNILSILLISLALTGVKAATISSAGNGNWNTGGTWSGGSVPSSGDSVVILNTHLVTLDMPGSGNNLALSLTIKSGGVLEYRSSGIAILQLSNTLNIDSGGVLRTITGSTQVGHQLIVAGNVTNAGTFNIQLNYLKLGGNLTGGGTTYADSISAIIETNGSSSQTINTTLNNKKIGNVIFYNTTTFSDTVKFTRSAKFLSGSVSGIITLGNASTNSFDYERKDGTHPSITKNYGSGTNNFTYTNTSCITTGSELPTSSTLGTLTMNSTTCVTLNAAFTIQKLTMTAGILYTTSTNILTMGDTGRYDVTRTGGWVSGPMVRTIPSGLNTVDATRVYLFPLGKTSYAGFEMVTPITRNTTDPFTCPSLVNCKIKAESFDGATGGNGANFTALRTNRYWNYSVSANTCIFYSSGIRVYDSLVSDTVSMGVASSKTGSYNNIGGFYYANTLGGTQPIYPSLYSNNVYINLGGKKTLAGGTYTVGHSGRNYQSITSVSNALHSFVLTGDVIFEFYDNYTTNDEVLPFTFWPFAVRGGDWHATLRPNAGNSGDLLSQGDPSDPNYHAFRFALTTFEGTRNLTIDGRKGGTGSTPAWIFRNTGTTTIGPVFRYQNDACSDTIKYVMIEGQNNNTSGLVDFLNTSYSKGNDSNGVMNNIIRKRTDSPADYLYGIYCNYTTSGPLNDNNTIDGNYIENCKTKGIYIGPGVAGDRWNISNNHLYCSDVMTASQIAIDFSPSTSKYNKINGNYIGGSSSNAAGLWTNSASGPFSGIYFSADTSVKQEIIGNTIKNFSLSNATLTYFYGIWLNKGNVYISNNTIGDVSNDSSILVKLGLNIYGILADSFTNVSIGGNSIGGYMTHKNNAAVTLYGLKINSVYAPDIYNNTIKNINIVPYTTSNAIQTLYGVFVSVTRHYNGFNLRKNNISNLNIADGGTGSSVNRAIYIKTHTLANGSITQCKVKDLTNNCTGASTEITGIYLDDGNTNVNNNQVKITNGSYTNDLLVHGIYDLTASTNTNNFYYNSVYIGGSVSSGTVASYPFRRSSQATVNVKNNLFYNARTGGSGAHLGFANSNTSPTAGWSTTASMHNLLVVTDTSKVAAWSTTVYGVGVYKTKSAGDTTSWMYTTSDLPADSLFSNLNTNLNINTTKPHCFAVNGKGTQISTVSEDIDDSLASRSTIVTSGAPDIGSDEIAPSSSLLPMQLTVTGSHTNSGTEIFQQGGRKVAEITWGASGTLPTLSKYLYYTGTWPNDTTNGGHGSGKRYINAYLRIDTSSSSAGAGYTYTLKYYYDNALLGKIQSESSLIFAKKKTNIAATWDSVMSRTLNTFQNTISSTHASKFTSFSEFTLSENNSSVLPIIFTSNQLENDHLHWTINSQAMPDEFQIFKNTDHPTEIIAHISFNKNNSNIYYHPLNDNENNCYMIKALKNGEVLDQTNWMCSKPYMSSKSNIVDIYPNPAQNYLYIHMRNAAQMVYIKLIDINGKTIILKNEINPTEDIKLEVNNLAKGIYILQTEIDGMIQNKKISILE